MKTKIKNPIFINADSSHIGINMEYSYIKIKHPGWKPIMQALLCENGKYYDMITIENVKTKETKNIFFDINKFFGKF